jgi:hypothetical protein
VIYIRGDANPFILTGKSDEVGTKLFGYWSGEFPPGSERASHQTDRSRLVADGAASEVEQVIADLPITKGPR